MAGARDPLWRWLLHQTFKRPRPLIQFGDFGNSTPAGDGHLGGFAVHSWLDGGDPLWLEAGGGLQ